METPRRLVLRAELLHDGGVLLTHTLRVTGAELTLACTRHVPEGSKARITLSFPGLVEPFDVEATALGSSPGEGHGNPPSVTFAVGGSPAARARLEALVALRSIAPPAPGGAAPGVLYRCLLVEDNAFIRDLFSFAIDKYCADHGAGVVMDFATDAEQAWRMLSEVRYDIALVDHFLPGESGAALIARLRADPRTGSVPVVAISVGGEAARDATFDAGADMFLDKPLAMKDLFTTLDKLTRRRA